MCCALPGYRRAQWTGIHLPLYEGMLWFDGRKWTPHDAGHEGCARAWQLCGFAQSVERYRRRRAALADGHIREANPLLDRCDDDLVHEAVAFLEAIEATHFAENEIAVAQVNAV
ncbi:MAG: hypothetical protein KC636_02430 [Myxococcales bacterium]|nr:hypothetical protein [Myxococcales bacterium]